MPGAVGVVRGRRRGRTTSCTRSATRPTAAGSSTTTAILLVHLSGEDGDGWTALAVDRATRRWAVGQARTQLAAATRAVDELRGRGADRPAG